MWLSSTWATWPIYPHRYKQKKFTYHNWSFAVGYFRRHFFLQQENENLPQCKQQICPKIDKNENNALEVTSIDHLTKSEQWWFEGFYLKLGVYQDGNRDHKDINLYPVAILEPHLADRS